ncbi:MAG: DMT family transporter [Pseudomonadota bacterium]
MTPRREGRLVAYALLACAVFFWAGNWAIGRALRFDAPPVAITFWRWVIAALVLLPLTAADLLRHWPAIRGAWGRLCILALLATVLQHVPVYTGLRSTPAINGSLLNSTSPIFIVLIGALFFAERLRPAAGLGVLLSLGGVAWIVTRGDPAALAGLALNPGDFWILLATVSWAVYTLCLRWLEIAGGARLKVDAGSVLGIGYIGVFATVAAYIFWNRGVQQLGPNAAGPFMYLLPVFTALLSVAFLGETLQAYHIVGTGLIFLGIYLASRRRARA